MALEASGSSQLEGSAFGAEWANQRTWGYRLIGAPYLSTIEGLCSRPFRPVPSKRKGSGSGQLKQTGTECDLLCVVEGVGGSGAQLLVGTTESV